jgi:hypothetical protein
MLFWFQLNIRAISILRGIPILRWSKDYFCSDQPKPKLLPKQKLRYFGSLWSDTENKSTDILFYSEPIPKTNDKANRNLNRNCFHIRSKDWIKRKPKLILKPKPKLILKPKPKIPSYESSMIVNVLSLLFSNCHLGFVRHFLLGFVSQFLFKALTSTTAKHYYSSFTINISKSLWKTICYEMNT